MLAASAGRSVWAASASPSNRVSSVGRISRICSRPPRSVWTELGAPIRWQCSVCDDEGVISNWEDSPFDLRRRRLTLAGAVNEIVIPDEVAAALRELQLLDTDCQRLVFAIRAHTHGAILAATDDDLDELIGFVAAEANHEPNRRRQQRLDAAFEALNATGHTLNGW